MSKEPQIVYVVTVGEYSDNRIFGVFSTRELAVQNNPDSNAIEEWVLDNLYGKPGHLSEFFVKIGYDGVIRQLNPTSYCGDGCDDGAPYFYPELIGTKTQRTACSFHVLAQDAEHAVKIASEKRARLIAEGKWTL